MALMNGEGDFAAARAILETIPYPRYDTRGQPIWDDAYIRWRLLMLERVYTGAEKLLVDFPLEQFPGPAPDFKKIFSPAPRGQKEISPRPANYLSRCEGTGNPWFGNIRIRRRSLGSVCFMPTSAGRRRHCARATGR